MRFSSGTSDPAYSDPVYQRLSGAVLFSLLLHGLLLSLQLGIPGLGLPGMELPWNERRAMLPPLVLHLNNAAPLAPVLVPEPVPPVPLTVTALPAPVLAQAGLVLLAAGDVPQPRISPAKVVNTKKKNISPPSLKPVPVAAEPAATPTRVIAQEQPRDDSFVMPMPSPEEPEHKVIEKPEAKQEIAPAALAIPDPAQALAAEAAHLAEMAELALSKEQQALFDREAEQQAKQLEQQAAKKEENRKQAERLTQQQAEQLAEKKAIEEARKLAAASELRQQQALEQTRQAHEQESLQAALRQKQSQEAAAKQKVEALAARQKAEELALQKAAELKLAEQKLAEQKLAEQKLVEQKLVEQKLAEQKLAEQKLAEQKLVEQKLAEQKLAEQKLAEQKLAEQKLAEQKLAEQKLAEQRAAQQRERALAESQAASKINSGGTETFAGSGALPKDLFSSDLANRSREQSKGWDVLRGTPPTPRQPGSDERARRRSFLGSFDKEVPLRMYVDSWRQKIERNGNLNYSQVSKDKARGDPLVLVAIRSDGSVEEIAILRSSGRADLDEAVRRIVRVNAPYAVFPPNIAAKYDVIEIRRVWNFDETLHILEELR